MDKEKAQQIEDYYKKCADEGASQEDIEASKKAMSSLEIILSDSERLERLAADIHDHYVSACANEPDRVQKVMIVCSKRDIAYDLLKKFKEKYPKWFIERKIPEELEALKEMPFIAMVASVGKNDKKEMYEYLGGVKNDKRSDDLDAAFKAEKSNLSIVIVVDMWITGFDVPCLTYMYNDKPLQRHQLIQTISRVNRKYLDKEFGLIVDYIGIRDNMREALKIYGGNNSIAPTADDIEQATMLFRENLGILKDLFNGGLLEIHEHLFLRYVLEYFDMKLSISIEEAEWIICNAISDAQKTPDAEEMLTSLQSMGIRTGVISNLCWSGNALTRRLHEHFPNHQFEFILTSSEHIFRKPEKLIFDLAIRKSGLNRVEIWYCGNDIAVDIYGANNAGLFPVFYDNRSIPSALHEKNDSISFDFPCLRISSWKELTNQLKNQNGAE